MKWRHGSRADTEPFDDFIEKRQCALKHLQIKVVIVRRDGV